MRVFWRRKIHYRMSKSECYGFQVKLQKEINSNRDFICSTNFIGKTTILNISKRRNMRNSFNPAFHGTIVEEIDYAVLSGSVGVGEGVIAFAISTISFFVFVLGWILVKPDRRPVEAVIRGLNGMKVVSVPWWEPCLFIVGFIAFAVAFFGIGILAQKSKMEDIVNLIESTIMESEK